jgi:predicted MFS family arabinose efflux permease
MASSESQRPVLSERRIVFLIGAVQLINVLDFVMVMPLGPDFARALAIPPSQLGTLVAGYGQAAAVAGFLGSFFLDRFDRRKALAATMLGMVLGTLAGGFARNLAELTLTRVVAGAFGGPATAISFAIIADVIPGERRGKAMGAVMGAFSVAQVLGVPLALVVSERFGWNAPFFGVATLGAVIACAALLMLPPLTIHLEGERATQASFAELLSRPTVLLSYLMTAALMASGFLIIPNLAAYNQFNLGYPRDRYQYLLVVSGVVSFFGLRLAGWLVDRQGSFRIGTAGVALGTVLVYYYFVRPPEHAPVMFFYCAFLVLLGTRNVAYNTLTSKVPHARERARFLSLQSTIYHATGGVAAWLAAALLTPLPDGRLGGISQVAWASMALGLLMPLFLFVVERRVARENP